MILSVIKSVITWTILFALFVILTPGLPPHDVEFVDNPTPPDPIKFDGPLTPNDWLDHVELLSGKIDNPSIGYLKVRRSFLYLQ
jgi:hypothetical protein